MSEGVKEKTKELSFLELCQDIYWDLEVTYLLAQTAWEKKHKMNPLKWHKHII